MNTKKISQSLSKFSKKELDSFFKHAKRVYKSQAFTILTNNKQGPFSRLLVIASKKYGKAPERNKIKRRLKAIFWEEKLYEKDKDVVCIVRPEAKKITFNQLKELFLKHLS